MRKQAKSRFSGHGPARTEAAAIYSGAVMHHRMKPRVHRFSYSVFTVLLDLDRLDEADQKSRLFSVNHMNLLSFHEKDHGNGGFASLRHCVDALLAAQDVERPHRVLLLAYPRILGYGFNPLSVYYAFDSNDQLLALIYEVRNTFGDMHTYVAPVKAGEVNEAGIRQQADKEFYVSPFLDMQQKYYFRMVPPDESVRIRILEKDKKGPVLSATFAGDWKPFTTVSLARECMRVPFLSFKVMAAIHWEAFKLWLKRVPFHKRPASDKTGRDKSPFGDQRNVASER